MSLKPNFAARPVKPLTSWSYSRYAAYQQCPFKFKLEVLQKVPVEKGAALTRGAEIHDQARDFLQGTIKKLPPSLAVFGDEFKRLRAKVKKSPGQIIVEDNWAFTKSWGRTVWDDWSGCYLRVKLDVAERVDNVVEITDWKTGRFRKENREDYMEQLQLYETATLAVFSHIPDLRVKARLVYLDEGVVYPGPGEERVVEMKDLTTLQKSWEKRVAPMFKDKTFAPKPNQWCRTCPHRKDAGGPCKF